MLITNFDMIMGLPKKEENKPSYLRMNLVQQMSYMVKPHGHSFNQLVQSWQ